MRALLLAALVSAGGLAAAADAPAPASNDPVALRAEIEHLKSIAQGQSLAMMQVAYNFNMLWFAARAKNWPLAQFYYGDARGRLRLALRVQPVRKISTGDLALQPLLDGLEKGAWAKLGETHRGQGREAVRGPPTRPRWRPARAVTRRPRSRT